jgi:uncharacterized membrane protein YtjA (UPF0391 family)
MLYYSLVFLVAGLLGFGVVAGTVYSNVAIPT